MVFVQCNKLSVNAEKIKFTRERVNITLALQTLRINNIFVINNTLVKWVAHVKFLMSYPNINLTSKSHINLIEWKMSTPQETRYQAKFLLNQKSRKSVYVSFMQLYKLLQHCLGSASKIKLRQIFRWSNVFCLPSCSFQTIDDGHKCTKSLPNKYIWKLNSTLSSKHRYSTINIF